LSRLKPMMPAVRYSADAAVAVNPSHNGLRDRRAVGLLDQKWKCLDHVNRTPMTAPTNRYPRSVSIWRF
jgi:hypothetical protein